MASTLGKDGLLPLQVLLRGFEAAVREVGLGSQFDRYLSDFRWRRNLSIMRISGQYDERRPLPGAWLFGLLA